MKLENLQRDALNSSSRSRRANNRQDHMERFWSNSIFKYLRVEPEDHYFLLTEPVRFYLRCPVQSLAGLHARKSVSSHDTI